MITQRYTGSIGRYTFCQACQYVNTFLSEPYSCDMQRAAQSCEDLSK